MRMRAPINCLVLSSARGVLVMVLPIWNPPGRVLPSEKHKGEIERITILSAVGEALSTWEHAESALIKLFQLLCETKSFAACRAYGTIRGVPARGDALEAAAEVFFHRDRSELKEVTDLIRAYVKAGSYRNNIAHGIAVQPHSPGYFLCPPSYAKKKMDHPDPRKQWGLGAHYFYKAKQIDDCRDRFLAILKEAMRLAMSLNDKYKVLKPAEFHP